MIEKHAHLFTVSTAMLVEFKYVCAKLANENDGPVPANVRQLASDALYKLRQAYILSEVDLEIRKIDRLLLSVDPPLGYPVPSSAAVAMEVKNFISGLFDILDGEFYFHLTPADVPLYRADEPFGPEVTRKFPKATEDIAEAAKCLALQRPTAAVFHLMRVMELALRAFATKLKVTTIDPSVESWNKISDHTNKAISALPGKTAPEQAKKAKFGSISAHLNSVRIAWRNEVMHPKQSYSREEAHTIFAAVRAFMIDLAALK